jgi:pyrimidine-specific ribonucleoside hydrolase
MQDVQKGVRMYGLNSPEYWDYIRQLALQYWIELDRREIFDIKPSPA